MFVCITVAMSPHGPVLRLSGEDGSMLGERHFSPEGASFMDRFESLLRRAESFAAEMGFARQMLLIGEGFGPAASA